MLAKRFGEKQKTIDGTALDGPELVELGIASTANAPTTQLSFFFQAVDERQDDPIVELSFVRARELENLMTTGLQRAEAALLGAGFLGGASTTIIFSTILVGFVFGTGAVYASINSSGVEGSALQISGVICLAWGVVVCWTRALFLYRKMYRRAYWSLISTMALWAILVLINCAIAIVLLYTETEVAVVRQVCGSAPSQDCSGSNLKIIQALNLLAYLILAVDCLYALSISVYLAEGRLQAASSAMV